MSPHPFDYEGPRPSVVAAAEMLEDVDFQNFEQVEAACFVLLDAIKALDEALSLTQDRIDMLEQRADS
jgi:hypothetical protein